MSEFIAQFPVLPTVLSALFAFLLGLVWYHPKVMGETWLAARGKHSSEVNLYKPLFLLVSLVLWLLSAIFYTFLADFLDLQGVAALLCLSSLLWVAFAMPPTLMGALYTGYPFQAVSIDSAYQLAGYYVFGLVHIAASFFVVA